MKEIKIYCEDGAMTKKVRSLRQRDNIKLISFPFENFNKRTIDSKFPSNLTCDTTRITADSDILISDTLPSEIFNSIKKIVGANHFNDIRHIDTAYKENCKIFISPDKDDIINNGEELESITGIKFFFKEDFDLIENYINELYDKLHDEKIMNIDKLARTLWKIHSHSLYPFYVDKIGYEKNWDDLPNQAENENDVCKDFFRKIAEFINENK
jgi:hypothetical protein